MRFREHRFPCDHPATLLPAVGPRQDAVVVNISTSGARVARVTDLHPGAAVRLVLSTGLQPHEAQVRWTTGDMAGLRFAQPLDARTLALVRKSVAHAPTHKSPGWNLHLRELR